MQTATHKALFLGLRCGCDVAKASDGLVRVMRSTHWVHAHFIARFGADTTGNARN